ncbi:MAG: glycosyltransferase family 4 protein [Clostridium sp.]|nr:glycosyltransferase family 4 protein [Clostridium sp.]MDU7084664.1 glycosyltransferase family 4 protein [Clostridium sp.]
MKVMQVSNFYAEFKGSFINQLEELEKKVNEDGGSMVYVFPLDAKKIEWCNKLQKNNKVYFVSNTQQANQKQIIKELKAIIDKEQPDIIHSHFDGYDVPITKASSKDTIKVYHRHNEFDVSKLCWYKKIYALTLIDVKMRYLKKEGYNIFITHDMQKVFVEKGIAIKEKSITILNGIFTRRLEGNIKTIRHYEKPVIFSFMGNWYSKGGDLIFKAIEEINKKEVKVYLASIISEFHIKQYYGNIPKWFILLEVTEDIKAYYNTADLFVSSSRKETFSYALAEAIYCKLPCISSDIDGTQWAKEFETIEFFESENIDELINKINYVLNNKYSKEKLEHSKEILKNKFSEQVWSTNIMKFYENIKGKGEK